MGEIRAHEQQNGRNCSHRNLNPIDGAALNPAPNTAFVAEIFLAKLALEVSFFAYDDDAIDQDEADWHGEQHPGGIDQDRQPKS